MPKKRKVHTPEFKVKVALEAIRGLTTATELAQRYQIHPVQIAQWKRHAIEHMPEAFQRGPMKKAKSEAELTAPLFEEIGRLKMTKKSPRKGHPFSGTKKRPRKGHPFSAPHSPLRRNVGVPYLSYLSPPVSLPGLHGDTNGSCADLAQHLPNIFR